MIRPQREQRRAVPVRQDRIARVLRICSTPFAPSIVTINSTPVSIHPPPTYSRSGPLLGCRSRNSWIVDVPRSSPPEDGNFTTSTSRWMSSQPVTSVVYFCNYTLVPGISYHTSVGMRVPTAVPTAPRNKKITLVLCSWFLAPTQQPTNIRWKSTIGCGHDDAESSSAFYTRSGWGQVGGGPGHQVYHKKDPLLIYQVYHKTTWGRKVSKDIPADHIRCFKKLNR